MIKTSAHNLLHPVLIAAALMTLGSAMTTQAAPVPAAANQGSDSAITSKIKQKFAGDTRLQGSTVNVETSDGAVTLSGTVTSYEAKTAAGELASNTAGVKHVNNKVETPTLSQTFKNGFAGAVTGFSSAASDSWITTKVKSGMATDTELQNGVQVTTNNGVVILSGQVPNQAAHDRAIAIAKQTDGVKDVNDDDLKIGPQ